MSKLIELLSSERDQILIFLGISLFIAILTGILYVRNVFLFKAFFGDLNPLLAVFIVVLVGTILSVFLNPTIAHKSEVHFESGLKKEQICHPAESADLKKID